MGRFPRSLIRRSAGSASSYTPGASPRATATRRAASPARTVTGRTRRSPRVTRTEHPKQPIAASFGADDTYRGFDHWYRLPYAFLPCYRTRSAGGGPLLDCRGPLAAQHRTSGVGAALQLHPTVTAAGGEVSHPARSYGASRRRTPSCPLAGAWRTSRCAGADRRMKPTAGSPASSEGPMLCP